eukprot:336474-Chlamydomonas_euryale.AAC.2
MCTPHCAGGAACGARSGCGCGCPSGGAGAGVGAACARRGAALGEAAEGRGLWQFPLGQSPAIPGGPHKFPGRQFSLALTETQGALKVWNP